MQHDFGNCMSMRCILVPGNNKLPAYQRVASMYTCFWQQDHSAGKANDIDLCITCGVGRILLVDADLRITYDDFKTWLLFNSQHMSLITLDLHVQHEVSMVLQTHTSISYQQSLLQERCLQSGVPGPHL